MAPIWAQVCVTPDVPKCLLVWDSAQPYPGASATTRCLVPGRGCAHGSSSLTWQVSQETTPEEDVLSLMQLQCCSAAVPLFLSPFLPLPTE